MRPDPLVALIMGVMALALCAVPIEGQRDELRASSPADADAFRLGAFRASERYRDPALASLDGYRSVGPDFPGMGRHWLQFSALMNGELDPDRPALLCYVEIDGRPTLVNVAYGMALRGGREPPPVAGLPLDPWHEHRGSVEDEMLQPHGQDGGGHSGVGESGPRVVMFHVWTIPNPAGSFAQHNWALPFLRAGLPSPDEPSEFAARFVGLGTEAGLRYQLEVVGVLFPEHVLDEARSQVEDAAEAAARWIGADRSREAVDSVELRQLAEAWRALGTALVGLAPDEQIGGTIMRLHGLGPPGARENGAAFPP